MRITLLAALLAAAVPIPALAQALPPPKPLPGDSAEDVKLKTLFYDSDEASLKRNPISAIFRGDLRYADRIGDWFTPQQLQAEKAAAEADLRGLSTIDRAKLTHVDQIAFDVFKNQTEVGLRGFAPELLPLQELRPLDHFRPSIPTSPAARARLHSRR